MFVPLLIALACSPEIVTAVDVETSHTSNIFLDSSEEWELGLHARGEVGLDLAPYWSLGYAGELSLFSQHGDLDAHFHELYAFMNPAWGEDLPTDLTVELSLATLKNQQAYSDLDYLRPALVVELGIEPERWFRARIAADLSYRWFYGAGETSALDAWTKASVSVNLPSRTTLSVWTRLGARWFVRADDTAIDDQDTQIEVALHLGQGLWSRAGLQLDYVFRRAFGPSGLLLQSLTDEQVNNVGTEFLYSGHRAALGIKQMLSKSAFAQGFLRLESRDYEGWPAYDAAYAPIGDDRRDLRVSPGLRVALTRVPTADSSAAWPRFDIWAEYRFLAQSSNSSPFDTQAHITFASMRLSW